jgi:hypothetical protein
LVGINIKERRKEELVCLQRIVDCATLLLVREIGGNKKTP